MRVYCCVKTVWILAALTAATLEPLVATAESDDGPIAVANSRFVVLGIDGKVVPDADPVLYFPKKLSRVYVDRSVERHALPSYSELDPVALGEWQGPDVTQQQRLQDVNKLQDQFVAQVMAPTVQEADEDEFSGSIEFHLEVHPLEFTPSFFLDSEVPVAQGSIVFAELSCFFVAFIGYLVHSIRLWGGLSRGQKCCLSVVFGSAALYQAAVVAWYVELLSSDTIVGLSSLITRMISLGMVPITTTSFMGRARELCQEQHAGLSPRSATGTSSRSSRRHRHHQRARYS